MGLPAIDHLDVWVSAKKSSSKQKRGRSSGKSKAGFEKLKSLVLHLAMTGQFSAEDNFQTFLADDIYSFSTGFAFKSNTYTSSGTLVFRVTNFDAQGKIDLTDSKYFPTKKIDEKLSKFLLKENDILMVMVGGSIGKTTLVKSDLLPALLNQNMWCIRPKENKAIPEFAQIHIKWLNSFTGDKTDSTHGHFTMAKYKKRKIEIPPLEEQKRIVAKVDELMGIIDDLEAQTDIAHERRAELTDALLRALVESEDGDALVKNWKTLSQHFVTLFTTEKSVEKLRNTILKLAVRGKIVRQKDNTQNARDLLKGLRLERKKKEISKEIKKTKLQPLDGSFPHEIPNSWAWVTFPEIGMFERGKSKHRPRNDKKLFNPGVYPLVQTGEIARANKFVTEVHSYYSEFGLAQSRLWPKGTLCITIAANIADTAILNFDACFPDSVVGFIPFEPISDVNYFLYFVKTAKQELLDYAPSTAQKNINLGILGKVAIPLPPLEEQERIVRKVDEMMMLCDNLLAKIRISEALKVELAKSVVHHASAT